MKVLELLVRGLALAIGVVAISAIVVVVVAAAVLGAAVLGAALAAPMAFVMWIAWNYSIAELGGPTLTYVQVWAGVILANSVRVLVTKGFAPKEVVEGTLKKLSTK